MKWKTVFMNAFAFFCRTFRGVMDWHFACSSVLLQERRRHFAFPAMTSSYPLDVCVFVVRHGSSSVIDDLQ
jgi:hypothetical protein